MKFSLSLSPAATSFTLCNTLQRICSRIDYGEVVYREIVSSFDNWQGDWSLPWIENHKNLIFKSNKMLIWNRHRHYLIFYTKVCNLFLWTEGKKNWTLKILLCLKTSFKKRRLKTSFKKPHLKTHYKISFCDQSLGFIVVGTDNKFLVVTTLDLYYDRSRTFIRVVVTACAKGNISLAKYDESL